MFYLRLAKYVPFPNGTKSSSVIVQNSVYKDMIQVKLFDVMSKKELNLQSQLWYKSGTRWYKYPPKSADLSLTTSPKFFKITAILPNNTAVSGLVGIKIVIADQSISFEEDPVWWISGEPLVYDLGQECEQELTYDICSYLDYINSTYIHYNNETNKEEIKSATKEVKISYECNPSLVNINCKDVSIDVDGKIIEWQKIGWFCNLNDNILTCDAPHQSNKDGICQSGERCVTFDIADLSKRTDSGYAETKQIEELNVK